MERAVLAILAAVGALALAGASIFAFARRNNHRLRSVRLAVFAGVVTFVAATTSFIVLARVHYFDALGHQNHTGIHVVFTSQTYNLGTALFSLDGSVRGLRPGRELWIVFRGAQEGHFFPASAPCDTLPNDLFSCRQSLTGNLSPAVMKVRGYVVVATPGAAAIFRRYNSGSLGTTGLPELPGGATQISQISVGA